MIYFTYFNIQLKSLLQYKLSFILTTIGQTLTSLFSFLTIYFLFDRFGDIKGYTFMDVLICFIVSYFGYSISQCFFRGFDYMDEIISDGEFDRMLVRPRSLILQVLGSKIEFNKMGRALLSLVVFIGLLIYNPNLLIFDKLITILFMVMGTIIIYSSLFLLKGGITFFTTQSLEIMNIFTDGGRDLSQYPLNIYKKWVLKFFSFIVPLAFVNYYPLLYVIDKSDNLLFIFAPFVSILFILPCYFVWKIGVKNYKSVGS